MIPDQSKKTISIPVRFKDGEIEFFYGGPLPRISENAIGDLIVSEYSITDIDFVTLLEEGTLYKLLPSHTRLMVEINPKEFKKELNSHISQIKAYKSNNKKSVEIILLKPLEIVIRGRKKAVLQDCSCRIEALDETAISLNHAYTLISEAFEVHRKSHTGNVFEKIYCHEGNTWRPLDNLRDKFRAQYENELFARVKKMNEDLNRK